MRILLGQCLLLLVSLALPGTALAACLLDDYSVPAEYDRSVAVITGRAVAERAAPESTTHSGGTVYTVHVDEVYRGGFLRPLELFSENSSGRFPIHLHERYVLFIYQGLAGLSVDNCGNSGPISQKTDVVRSVKALAIRRRGGQKPNKPLERSGVNACLDAMGSSAGRPAPSR